MSPSGSVSWQSGTVFRNSIFNGVNSLLFALSTPFTTRTSTLPGPLWFKSSPVYVFEFMRTTRLVILFSEDNHQIDGDVSHSHPLILDVNDVREIQPNTVIKLNVGGGRYETTVMTISKFPESYLMKLVAQEEENISDGQEIFVDRDPSLFRLILQFYREPNDLMLPRKLTKIKELLREAHFFQLEPLESELNSLLRTYPFAQGDVVKFDPEIIGQNWDLSRLHGNQTIVTVKQHSVGSEPGNSESQRSAIASLKGRIEELNEHVARVRFVELDEHRLLLELLASQEEEFTYIDAFIVLGALKKVE